MKMRILIACEESQAVCIEFRKMGHEAFSCDVQDCSGGHPEWHIKGDVLDVIDRQTGRWGLMIAFPPCTYLTVTGNKWFKSEFKDRFPTREQDRIDAINFFMKLVNAPINKICVENPVGIMSRVYRKPDQIIQPYYFGDKAQKTTCLWLKNLPLLQHLSEDDWFGKKTHTKKGGMYTYKNGRKDPMWHVETMKLPPHERTKARSKTFPGIAKAMAEQWNKI